MDMVFLHNKLSTDHHLMVGCQNAIKNKSTWVHTRALHAILSVKFQKQNIHFFQFFSQLFCEGKVAYLQYGLCSVAQSGHGMHCRYTLLNSNTILL